MPLRALPPQGSASANFATWACSSVANIRTDPPPARCPVPFARRPRLPCTAACIAGDEIRRAPRSVVKIAPRRAVRTLGPAMTAAAQPAAPPALGPLLAAVAERARAPGVFADIRQLPTRVEC